MSYCEMCGAATGELHHDPAARGKVVTLHYVEVPIPSWDAGPLPMPEGRIVCMLCRDGIYAIRREERAKSC